MPRGSAPPHGARSLWEYVANTHGSLEVPLDARRLVQPPPYAAAPPPRLGRPAAVAAASFARRSLAECRHERRHLWPLMTRYGRLSSRASVSHESCPTTRTWSAAVLELLCARCARCDLLNGEQTAAPDAGLCSSVCGRQQPDLRGGHTDGQAGDHHHADPAPTTARRAPTR